MISSSSRHVKVAFMPFPRRFCFVSLFFVSSLFTSGCQGPRYTDPYSGDIDKDRNFKSEGLIATFYNVTVGANPLTKNKSESGDLKNKPVPFCAEGKNIDWAYLDKLEQELRKDFHREHLFIHRRKETVWIEMPNVRGFPFDMTHVEPSFYPVLDRLTKKLAEYPETRIEVIGHADDSGPVEYNQLLSEHRAYNVERYLNKNEVLPERTVGAGKGEMTPRAENADDSARTLNRRISLVVCSTGISIKKKKGWFN